MAKTITHLLTQDIIIRRYKSVSGDRKAFSSTATVDGLVQNVNQNKVTLQGIVTERKWVAYFDVDENVLEGDQIIDTQNNKFLVKEVTKKDYGCNTHIEAVLEEANA